MASEIRTDLIKDKSNTKTLATLSDSAVTLDSSVVFPAGGTGNPISVAIICDEKATDSLGGSSTGDGELDRELNTTISDPDSIVSISSNQFTLGAGTYLIEFSAPCYASNRHHVRLYDQTAGDYVTKSFGSSEFSPNSDNVQSRSFGANIVSPTSSNIYKIRHYTTTGVSNSGLGIDQENSGAKCIYTIVKITKLK